MLACLGLSVDVAGLPSFIFVLGLRLGNLVFDRVVSQFLNDRKRFCYISPLFLSLLYRFLFPNFS